MLYDMSIDNVSRDCLRGQPLPVDLNLLWQANLKDEQPWEDFVVFALFDKLDTKSLIGYTKADGLDDQEIVACQRMFSHIAFVGAKEDGELVGYWLGHKNRPIAASPIVELDTEGQFHLRGRNLAEYLLSCVFEEEDYIALLSVLADLRISVGHESLSDLLDSFDELEFEFGSPNRLLERYLKGLEPPSDTDIPTGWVKFPRAKNALEKVGIIGITDKSTSDEVISLLGEPIRRGDGKEIPLLGDRNPWVKYLLTDCQLLFEFNQDKTIALIHFSEIDEFS